MFSRGSGHRGGRDRGRGSGPLLPSPTLLPSNPLDWSVPIPRAIQLALEHDLPGVAANVRRAPIFLAGGHAFDHAYGAAVRGGIPPSTFRTDFPDHLMQIALQTLAADQWRGERVPPSYRGPHTHDVNYGRTFSHAAGQVTPLRQAQAVTGGGNYLAHWRPTEPARVPSSLRNGAATNAASLRLYAHAPHGLERTVTTPREVRDAFGDPTGQGVVVMRGLYPVHPERGSVPFNAAHPWLRLGGGWRAIRPSSSSSPSATASARTTTTDCCCSGYSCSS